MLGQDKSILCLANNLQNLHVLHFIWINTFSLNIISLHHQKIKLREKQADPIFA